MTPNSLLMVAIVLFVTMLVGAMILLRVKIGKQRSGSPTAFATKRNSMLIIFVIIIFLMIWIFKMESGDLAEQGMSDTTALLIAVVGGASILLLLVDFIRKK